MLEGPGEDDTVLVDWGPHEKPRCRKENSSKSESWSGSKGNLNNSLKHIQLYTDMRLQITLPANTKQGKIGSGFGLTLPLIKSRKRVRMRGRKMHETKRKKERPPILD